ncbi:MAG: TatD family hydrolase [bacterium]|nr:TatD family hydrolase [bacterium]
MLIDTHAHLNFSAYKDDADQVVRRTLGENVWMINVGSQYSTSKRTVEMAERYPKGVFAAVGLHPVHLSGGIFKTKIDKEEVEFETREEDFDPDKYKELAKSKKVVAIGEVGLDYWYRPKGKTKLEQFKNKQKEVFVRQFNLAKELELPLIIHCRMAHGDMTEILDSKTKGVVHCFSGNWSEAQKYLEMGLYLGFNGIIFKLDLDEVIAKTPLDRILIETDCPYLTPPAMSGRNEPLYVKYVVDKIVKIKGLNFEEIADITSKNAIKLFNLHD